MKFHAAILAPYGQVFSPECRDSDLVAGNPISRKMMEEFQDLLREHLTDDPTRTGKFHASFGDLQHVLEWQQVEPLSAMGTFHVGGQVAAASFYLHGFVPELDDAVLEATEILFASWFGGGQKSARVCRRLRSIKERPVVIALPGERERLSPADWRIIGNLCPCFAAVFFARAEAAIKAIESYWHNRGYRKGGDETSYLRN